MALIKCNNCGHAVSDKAVKCPKCGTLIQKEEEVASLPVQEARQQVNQTEHLVQEVQQQTNLTEQAVQNPPPVQETPSAQPKQDVQEPPQKRVFVSASGKVYSYDEEPEKENANVAVWILVAVFVVTILAVGAYFLFFNNGDTKEYASDTPEETYAETQQEQAREEEEEDGGNCIVELTPEFIKAVQKYEELRGFSQGFAPVCKNGKWGFINTKGEEVIPCKYADAHSFSEGLACVEKNGKYGFINTEGEEVIPVSLKGDVVNDFSEGLAVIIKDYDSFYVIDTKGKTIFSKQYDFEQWGDGAGCATDLNYANGELYVPYPTGGGVTYNKKGEKLRETEFEPATYEKGIRDENGNLYTLFYKAHGDYEDYQWYTYGLNDEHGKEVIPAIYDYIDNIGNGVALVRLEEYNGEVFLAEAETWDSDDTKVYYGYADLKGNDTFSEELKRRCRKSKERAAEQLYLNQDIY